MIQLTNYIRSCEYNAPGTVRLLIAPWQENIADYFVYSDENDFSIIEDIQTSIVWFEFDVEKTVVDWAEVEELGLNRRRFNTAINLIIQKLDGEKRKTINELIRGKHMAMLKDVNGKWWFIGEETGLKSASYTASIGNNASENAYRLTFTTWSIETNKEIKASYIQSIEPPIECWSWCELIDNMDSVIINDLTCLLTDLFDPC